MFERPSLILSLEQQNSSAYLSIQGTFDSGRGLLLVYPNTLHPPLCEYFVLQAPDTTSCSCFDSADKLFTQFTQRCLTLSCSMQSSTIAPTTATRTIPRHHRSNSLFNLGSGQCVRRDHSDSLTFPQNYATGSTNKLSRALMDCLHTTSHR